MEMKIQPLFSILHKNKQNFQQTKFALNSKTNLRYHVLCIMIKNIYD